MYYAVSGLNVVLGLSVLKINSIGMQEM